MRELRAISTRAEITPTSFVNSYELLTVNAKGPYFTVQKLAPLMTEGGAVVVTTSVVNMMGYPMVSVYSASKAALRSMVRSLARELLPRGIRVNAVSPTLTGQPPILQNTGTEAIETLGELMLFDKNISPNRNAACASCHMPYAGFSGPIPSVNLTMIAYPGTAHHFRAGKRTAQRHPYAPFFHKRFYRLCRSGGGRTRSNFQSVQLFVLRAE
jgi:Enoyl-(Acyl carrier protein) reductase/Di-haem cytochrome c peroxidase